MYSASQSKVSRVRALADGKWDMVFGAFSQLSDAVKKAPRQVPCPVTTGAKGNSNWWGISQRRRGNA